MAPRRSPQGNPSNTQDSLSPGSPVAPRSASPSSGLTQFLSKPVKWFSRSASTSKVNPSLSSEPRSSLSFGGRKHKISQPTHPRPLLDSYGGQSTRSVVDLSIQPGPPTNYPPSLPSSPTTRSGRGQLGDLRNSSRRAWSRSADDLSKIVTENISPASQSFQEKIAEYRGRTDSNASPISPPSPITSPNFPIPGTSRHPFPSRGTTPPPNTPMRGATVPALTISVSSPAIEESSTPKSGSPGQGQVHIRSHSFTPKLPSKLSTPRFPPSPQRNGSHDGEFDMRNVDQPHGTPTRATTGLNNHKSTAPPEVHFAGPPCAANRQTTLLPPPIIIEPGQHPDQPESLDPRRTSQIVFHSGFINRFGDLPANAQQSNLQLSKGWKPFKLELKGSKLYFYKPPNDRAAGIKDLFPTSLVPPSQEDDLEPSGLEASSSISGDKLDGVSSQPSQPGMMGRKKRAFWGRRTHPDLILDDQTKEVVKGTFEALIHETVFATTFFQPVSTTVEVDGDIKDDKQDRILKWHEFASSVLLSVPFIVSGGKQVFEAEFVRCCSYLVSGAEEKRREEEKFRVAWLANEYLRIHGQPADPAAWDEVKKEIIPNISLSAEPHTSFSALMSTPGLYQPSSVVNPGFDHDSPNLDAFPPRPEEGRRIPLLDALFSAPPPLSQPEYPPQKYPHQPQPLLPGYAAHLPTHRFPWTVLLEEGLTKDILLHFDPRLVARSLTLFHQSVLEQCPGHVTADFVIGNRKLDCEDHHTDQQPQDSLLKHLFGSEDQPHWLTKLLLLQILGADILPGHQHPPSPGHAGSPTSPAAEHHGSGPHTSRTHSRSDVISIWAKVGEICRASGDECSWKAIAAALCSRPVSRLAKAWKRVDPHAVATVERWVSAQGTSRSSKRAATAEIKAAVGQPQLTPWGGDTKAQFNAEVTRASEEAMIVIAPLKAAINTFESFRTSFELCPRKLSVGEGELNEDVRRLVMFWKQLANEGGGRSGMSAKFQKVDQFMSLSLAAEPRRKGFFESYFWMKSTSNTPYASLIPLLFPDPLPALTLVDRSKLVRGRIDSDASEAQYLRSLEVQLSQDAGRQLHTLDGNKDFTKKLILGHGGTVISVYNGDLLLVTQSGGFESVPGSRPSSRVPSRPESSVVDHAPAGDKPPISRNPSIRVKPNSSHGLERKTSMARRSSLPAVSHLSRSNFVTSEPSSDPPLRVLVQAGTLNNLVNILVHGLENISVSVADDNGEMTLKEGMTRELALDKVEFARVWWNVFRSFLTPLVFFELLRKIYVSQPTGSSIGPTDLYTAFRKRTEVLNTMKDWLATGGGAQDVLDEPQLFNAVQAFLDGPPDGVPTFDFPPVQQAFEALIETRNAMQFAFVSQVQRPTNPLRHQPQRNQGGSRSAKKRNMITRDLPDLDRMDPEGFVDNLEGMASAAFSNLTEEDLYITADLLEVQSADRTGWFPPREAITNEEMVEIQTIYSHILEVEPSSLISELGQDSLYRLLPPAVRSCIRAYSLIRKWLISKLVAPRIGLRARQARVELLIQAIELSRLRNTETPATAQLVEQPCVRSFVEAVITSALLSPESRLHHRAWQSVAFSRSCNNCDSLSSLLHRPFVQSTSTQESLTVDMGWLLERMIEVIATPDVLDTSQDAQQLINFDKRRHLCNLVSKASCIPSDRKPPPDEAIRRSFERLNTIEKEVVHIQFDHRGIKEEAARESVNPGMNGAPSSKKFSRPFHKVVATQIEKNRRDKHLRTRLQREKLQEQNRNERRDDVLNKAMRPRKPASTAPKHRNKKSMSAFLNFMRPISSAFGADGPHIVPRRSPAELDFPTTGKPSLVVNVLEARIAQYVNNERSYTFQLETEDGGRYLFQAMNKRDMNKWLETISRVTNIAAKRRLTYLGSSPKPQIADHIHSQPIVPSRDPKAMFGVELEFLLRREAGSEQILPGTLPIIIGQCLSEIESRGLTEVGIYRIAGAATVINGLRDAFNRGESPIQPTTDIHAICDIVKSWFRVLPEPLFPPSSYMDVMSAMRHENLDERLLGIRSIVRSLPQANFDLLRRIAEHLDRVTDFEEHNHMTAEALAIVFSPNLLRAPQNDFIMILNNMGLTHKLVKAFITHFHTIFDETDPEAEAEAPSEDELDSAILEEDEDLVEGDENREAHDPKQDTIDDDTQQHHPPTQYPP